MDEDSALAKMAPIISHEIRNPLAVIGNSSYFIKTKLGATADPKVAKHLGIIESEIKRANETLGEILAYARMKEPVPTPQRLNALVEEAVKGLSADGVELKIELASKDPKISADAEILRPVFRHVVRNALEAFVGAKGKVVVKTGAGTLEVSDNGPGLAKEILEKLYVPFTTNKPRGIGLGLAYAKKALGRHKGAIEISSNGKGTRVLITLPAA
jgi:signal transduction histidine kinase